MEDLRTQLSSESISRFEDEELRYHLRQNKGNVANTLKVLLEKDGEVCRYPRFACFLFTTLEALKN